MLLEYLSKYGYTEIFPKIVFWSINFMLPDFDACWRQQN